MESFTTTRLPIPAVAVAPDGTDVRPLLELRQGSFAHFELAPGRTSIAVAHRTVEEIWFFLAGRGEVWRKNKVHEETVAVDAGVCLTIPLGTEFQFRCLGSEALGFIAVTMPPWPGEDEAYRVEGKWQPTSGGGLKAVP
jgi:mannose-6-phosphate isomerase-like protein (cupin superfamily)